MMHGSFLLAFAAALPPNAEIAGRIQWNNTAPCNAEACQKPATKYELISKSQPGVQWNDNGGYCGSWAIQRAMLAKGAWISQQQVRDHTSPSPGAPASHNNEILSPNIDEALSNLKIKGVGFDYKNMVLPQQDAYFRWLKKQLVAGHTVVWMIMWNYASYPAYNMKIPEGVHGHIEPVIGIQSNHPLTDETVYDDDNVVHYNDGNYNMYYPTFKSLYGDWSGTGASAECTGGLSYCIGPYSYGWALEGFLDEQEGLPLSLSIDPWEREPDLVQGSSPIAITGTLTATGLTAASTYSIYRWDSVEEAFTYSDSYKATTFTASSDTFIFQDPATFSSAGTTYYRCVEVGSDGVLV